MVTVDINCAVSDLGDGGVGMLECESIVDIYWAVSALWDNVIDSIYASRFLRMSVEWWALIGAIPVKWPGPLSNAPTAASRTI